ncbi:MAG: helix-turn-helix domain-containing protein [Phototrophicales bacterium]|jgi:DNA-binding transcriptional regulator GbsR (MarR family)|nr:helix-turn-helix domain-containing protein [Phototrophicales bacterium]
MSDKNGTEIHPKLAIVHDSMLDGIGQLADYFGFSKVMGQIYAALLLSPDPLSLDDLMERLTISKANVSMNMRTLEHMGMVRQVWLRGKSGRRKYYEASTDFIQIITNILSGREMRDVDRALHVMDDNVQLLSDALPKMDELDKERAQLYLDRIAQLQTLFKFAQLVITSILNRVADMDLRDISRIEIG